MMVHVAKALSMDGHDKINCTATGIQCFRTQNLPMFSTDIIQFEGKASGQYVDGGTGSSPAEVCGMK
jgi:hypothetical protein